MNTGIDAVELMGRIDNLGESLKKAIGEFRYADALRISSERMSLIKTFSEVAPKTAEFMPALRSPRSSGAPEGLRQPQAALPEHSSAAALPRHHT